MIQRSATAAVDGWLARIPGGRRLARLLAVLGLAASSSGCLLTKDLPDPALDIPEGYKAAAKSGSALYVSDSSKIPKTLRKEFAEVSLLEEAYSTYRDRNLTNYYFFLCRDFQGGASKP